MAALRASPVRAMKVTHRSWPQIVVGRKTWFPKAWSKWPWVSTTTVTGAAVNSRRSVRISRAWTCVERVSTRSTSPSPRTTPMFWSKNAYRRIKTRSPTSVQMAIPRW